MLNLNFSEVVTRRFSFLTTEYKFKLVESSEHLVRYESDKIFVNVRYDRDRSYELDVEIWERNVLPEEQDRPFSLAEALRNNGAPEESLYRCIQASTQPVLEAFIDSLADSLRRYGEEFLIGNKRAFAELGDQRDRECSVYAIDQKLVAVRRSAEEAWRDKNYVKIIALYESIEAYITPSERKKLVYARNKK